MNLKHELSDLTKNLATLLGTQPFGQKTRLNLEHTPSLKNFSFKAPALPIGKQRVQATLPPPSSIKTIAPSPTPSSAKQKKISPPKKDPFQQTHFTTQKVIPFQEEDFKDIENNVLKYFPKQTWHNDPLEDSKAKNTQNSFQESNTPAPCMIFLDKQKDLNDAFFQNLSHTLSFFFEHVSLLDQASIPQLQQEDFFSSSKIVLGSNSFLKAFQKDIKNKSNNSFTFKDIPLIILLPSDIYKANPDKKRLLWKEIKKHINSIH
jgi:hypothetical protein